MKISAPKPPAHLSAEARRLWARLLGDFHLDDGAGLALVRVACESFDRGEASRRAIAAEGATLTDRFGQRKPHPLLQVERDARAALVSALRAMRLQPGDVGGDEL